jgi:hypothetical protein
MEEGLNFRGGRKTEWRVTVKLREVVAKWRESLALRLTGLKRGPLNRGEGGFSLETNEGETGLERHPLNIRGHRRRV